MREKPPKAAAQKRARRPSAEQVLRLMSQKCTALSSALVALRTRVAA